MRFRHACQPDPRGVGRASCSGRLQPAGRLNGWLKPAATLTVPTVERDELDAGRADHLRRHDRLLHRRRPHPEHPPQVDAGGLAELRIESVAEVDEGGRLAEGGGGGEGGDDDGVALAAAGDLGHLAAGEAAAEQSVERLDGGGEDGVAPPPGDGPDQLRAVDDLRADARVEAGPKLLHLRPLPRFHR